MAKIILIASYPKSGNTWLRAVLTSLWRQGAPLNINRLMIPNCADRRLSNQLLGMSSSDLSAVEFASIRPRLYTMAADDRQKPLWLKIHDAWLTFPGTRTFPLDPDSIETVIYLIRDPREVAVSFSHHLGRSPNDTIRIMRDPTFQMPTGITSLRRTAPQLLSSWSIHAASWIKSFGSRLHVLRYEDILKNTQEALGAALRFAGQETTQDSLVAAIKSASFDSLRSQEAAAGFVERPPGDNAFFRSGRARSWPDALSPEQARRIARDHAQIMNLFGYETT